MEKSAPLSTYNILLLGETQSGKSTLVEALKLYADPGYTVNSVNIGDGIFSHTNEVLTSTIVTNSPDYSVSKATFNGPERVEYGDFINKEQEDFEDELNERKGYILEREASNAAKATFNLIDTPGLNDTSQFDESNIATIFKALEDIKSINLVVITVANNPFTDGLTDALKAYIDLLPDLNGIVVFVHTRIDYARLHPNESHFASALTAKKNILHHLMGRDSVPHLLIDNDIGSKRSIRNCITQNKLRELLAMAKLNQPVPLQVMVMKKTEKMQIVDEILKARITEVITAREITLGFKNLVQKEVLTKIAELKANITKHDQALQNIERDLTFYDKDTLALLYEQIYQQSFSLLSLMEGPQTMYYPGKSLSETSGFSHHIIDHIDIQARNVEVLKVAGGADSKYWAVQFLRKKSQNGLYHVKIYVTKWKLFTAEIEGLVTQQTTNKQLRDDYQADLESYEYQERQQRADIEKLLEQLRLDWYLHGRASSTHLDNKVLQALVKAKVYVREHAQSALNVEKFYSENKDELESMERFLDYITPPPIYTSEFSNDAGKDIFLNTPNVGLADFNSILKKVIAKSTAEESSITETRTSSDTCSVLVLGKSQAGKTALIQHIKNYATQDYSIDQSLLGDGIYSKTDTTSSFLVKSDLPSYEAFSKDIGQVIDLKRLSSKYKDDEDYKDLLLAREADVDLRLAPHDHDKPSLGAVELEFIDTPGLCNHEDKDSAHALYVIGKIVATRTFRLVLIVVNPHDPLSAELLLALQYYAEILGDLRHNIAFVFTHVDYLHSGLTDATQSPALKNRVNTLSRIFSGPTTSDLRPYPSFAIDLTEKRRPVVQGLIRNTLKDILQLAVSSPATLVNTDGKHVEGIKLISHPSNFDHEQRKEALDRIYEKSEPQSKVDTKEKKLPRRSAPEDVNILLIGDVQSGKTSLVETMKLYADSGSDISEELTVRGSNGAADEIVKVTSFRANLHTLELRVLKNGRHRIVDIEEDARTLSLEAFDYLLNLDQGSADTPRILSSVAKEHHFAIFEAPGLRDTEDLHQKIIAIYSTIIESYEDIHHILVTLGPDAITTTTEAFINMFTSMFVNVRPHISFVHTKVDSRQLHVSNEPFHDIMKDKKQQLQELTQTSSPIFMIDCGQHVDRPIQRAMSHNVVQTILQAATLNRPACSLLTLVKPQYSVLVLGQTQSGKSTLVQHIKQYADPLYKIDQSFLGDGNTSKTVSTIHFFIDSSLPMYEVQKKDDKSIVDLQNLHTVFEDEDDYLDFLNSREKDYILQESPRDTQLHAPQLVEFKFLDTPGLNDTDQRDTAFATHIIEQIMEAGSFNLILVVVSTKSPLSQEYGFALEYYSKVLEGLHSHIAFLHTHADYADCHHTNIAHHNKMASRHRAFSSIFRDRAYVPIQHAQVGHDACAVNNTEYKKFAIDMKVAKRPITQCMIRNTVRDILKLAVDSVPVNVDTSVENTERINALVHPDRANQGYRGRFREAMLKAIPSKQVESGETSELSQSLPALVAEGPAPIMCSSLFVAEE